MKPADAATAMWALLYEAVDAGRKQVAYELEFIALYLVGRTADPEGARRFVQDKIVGTRRGDMFRELAQEVDVKYWDRAIAILYSVTEKAENYEAPVKLPWDG